MFLGEEILYPVDTGGVLCGVYILTLNGDVTYIGQSTSLPARIQNHVPSNDVVFDDYEIVACDQSELNNLESELIVKRVPLFNNTLPINERFVTKSAIKNSIEFLLTQYIKGMDECYSYKQTSYVDTPCLNDFFDEMKSLGVNGIVNKTKEIKLARAKEISDRETKRILEYQSKM